MGQGMRERMKNDWNKRSGGRILSVFAAAAIAVFDVLIVKLQYDNYREKMDILCVMLNGKNQIDKAANILKTGRFIDTNNGAEMLNKYGYQLYSKNALYDKFLIQGILIVIISLIVFLIFCSMIYFTGKKDEIKLQKEIKLIEGVILDYKHGIVDKQGDIGKQFEKLNSVYDEVCSLGDTLKLLNEREIMEKESTKSLVSDISHQLKTPVAALKTCFEILQQDLSPEERTEFTERCNNQLLGIENLLSALINISRMEAGMIEIKLTNQCIFDTIVDAVNRVYEKATKKNIQIELASMEDTKEIYIPQDRKWLCEAIINILENAVKYSSANTNVTIQMFKMVMFLRIEISDEGIGIPKEEYNQIFSRFYRGNSSVVKKQQGSGIGLYLTREIINRHHGTIRVESGENGSKFIIQLPYR